MIFKGKPKHFSPRFDVVSCFFEHEGEILLLHRLPEKSQGNKWGVPAGKIESGETPLEAMVREAREETGLDIDPSIFAYVKKIFVRYSDYDFVYHIFHTSLNDRPAIMISPKEHQAFVWAKPKKALSMDIMQDLDACIALFYGEKHT